MHLAVKELIVKQIHTPANLVHVNYTMLILLQSATGLDHKYSLQLVPKHTRNSEQNMKYIHVHMYM